MPSRVIRGEILASRSLGRVSRDADAFFWRLLIAADDYGRLDGRLGVLRAICYPSRDEVCTGEIERWLEELSTCDPGGTGPVQLYEVDGERFIQLRNWEKHRSNSNRAKTSRFPDPRENPGESRNLPDLPEIPARLTSDVLRVTSEETTTSAPLRSASRSAKKARAPKPSAEAIGIFCEEFKSARGEGPFVPDRDKRELGAALSSLGAERYRAAARVFMGLPDKWIRDRSYNSRAFLQSITKCDLMAKGQARIEAARDGPDPAADVSSEVVTDLFKRGGPGVRPA